jgi:hypothetical protein
LESLRGKEREIGIFHQALHFRLCRESSTVVEGLSIQVVVPHSILHSGQDREHGLVQFQCVVDALCKLKISEEAQSALGLFGVNPKGTFRGLPTRALPLLESRMLSISSSVSWEIRAAEAASMSRRDMEERVKVSLKHAVKIKIRGTKVNLKASWNRSA